MSLVQPVFDAALPLYSVAATRQLEALAAASLPAHTLMQRAGLALARLALALAPHADSFWLACGGGNNGGDGLEAAMHLQRWGKRACVTWLGDPALIPSDARTSWRRACEAGVSFLEQPPADYGLCIDALLGIGATRAPQGRMADWLAQMAQGRAPVLSVDLPSGLDADSGCFAHGAASPVAPPPGWPERAPGAFPFASDLIAPGAGWTPTTRRFCLSLLTLKPGLFMAHGRDACGQLWFDDLGVDALAYPVPPSAWLAGAPAPVVRAHAAHKGDFGDVAVVGGAPGMTGAALLAASAALYGGAGRVYLSLLDTSASSALLQRQPELMLRALDALDPALLTLVCGCGGGSAVAAVLPRLLAQAAQLVLDADALNACAAEPALGLALRARGTRGQVTVITPHPLEAARLLACTTRQVQAARLSAAQQLADQLACVVVLKGSGSVIASPQQPPWVNPTGNARLASAGTGDVLAGLIGAELAAGSPALVAARTAVYRHGALADQWPAGAGLSAGALAAAAASARVTIAPPDTGAATAWAA